MAHNIYIDESIRDSYILCAVSVPTGQVTVARSQIRRLREPGRTSIHMQKETRTRQLLASIKSGLGVSVPHFRHIKYTHEPLLWLPDIVAWCYGRGGPWRDAVEPLVDEVIEI